MAGWREKLGPASFRGVPFFVNTTDRSGGRRLVVHEYPQKDEPYSEDLGRKTRELSVEGFVIGEEYIADRDALIEALEKEGPGELVHPLHGVLLVSVPDYRESESDREGGAARFSIQFVRTSAQPAQPTARPDATAKVKASAAAAKTSVGVEFLARYSPGVHLTSIGSSLRSATLAIDNILGTIAMEKQALATLKRQAESLSGSAAALAEEPVDMLADLVAVFEALGAGLAVAEVADASGANPSAKVLGLESFDPGVRPPATTANRLQEQTNFDATQRLIQRIAIIQAAELAILQKFLTYEQAVETREAITDLLDEQAETAADDTYPALLQLRADLVRAIPGDASELARLASHTPAVTVPSLALAYSLYGSLDQEADLLARNRVENPGMIVGGTALEVLSHG